jgi:hypothetical protein
MDEFMKEKSIVMSMMVMVTPPPWPRSTNYYDGRFTHRGRFAVRSRWALSCGRCRFFTGTTFNELQFHLI